MAHYGEKSNGRHYMGFKKVSAKMTDDDEILRKAEESAARLEAQGFGKEGPKPAFRPTTRPRPMQEDYEESEKAQRFRSRFRKMFGR